MAGVASSKLRVGIVVGGRLVAERLVARGEPLALGSAPGDLAVPAWPGRQPVLAAARNGWTLLVPMGATARLSVEGRSERIQGPGEVVLTGWVRGKLDLAEATVLFQAVEATVAAPVKLPRLRPRVVQRDDALLVSLMPMFAALGLVVVALAPPPLEQDIEEVIVDYGEAWRAIVVPPAVPVPEVRPPDPEPERVVGLTPITPTTPPDPRGATGGPRPLILELPTRGDSVDGLMASGTTEEIEAALKHLGGPRVVDIGSGGPRGRPSGPGEDAVITLGQIGDPRAVAVEELATTVLVEVIVEEPESAPADVDAVRAVVTGNRGQLKWCYEQRAKLDPDLSGRVEVVWNVHDGRVTAADLLVDGTGDAELGQCVVERVRRWRFPHGVEGEIVWPFLFRPKE